MRRKTARQIREDRHETIASMIMVAGLVLLAAGGFALNFELRDGLDHTAHACEFISYVAVLGSAAGCILTGLAGFFLICGPDA